MAAGVSNSAADAFKREAYAARVRELEDLDPRTLYDSVDIEDISSVERYQRSVGIVELLLQPVPEIPKPLPKPSNDSIEIDDASASFSVVTTPTDEQLQEAVAPSSTPDDSKLVTFYGNLIRNTTAYDDAIEDVIADDPVAVNILTRSADEARGAAFRARRTIIVLSMMAFQEQLTHEASFPNAS